MATQNTPPTPKVTKSNAFVVGNNVNVWKVTGVREGPKGPATSERLGRDYPDIDPSEQLNVVEKLGSNFARCRRPSRVGQKDEIVLVHINHITEKSGYYAARGTKSAAPKAQPQTAAQKLAQATAEAEAALKALDDAQAAASAETPAEENDNVASSVRDEAAELFAEAEVEATASVG